MNKRILSAALVAALLCSTQAPVLTSMAAEVPQSSAAAAEYVESGVVSGDYTYSLTEGKATITKYTGTASAVVIPSQLDGNTVTAVGNSVFTGKTITSVTIPDTVTSIGSSSFSNCTSLTSVTLSAALETIDSYAFNGDTNLKKIVFPAALKSIGTYSFKNTGLTEINLPSSVTSLGREAFCSTKISYVAVPNTVTSFGDYVFSNNAELTHAKLGASSFTKSIYSNMFTGCAKLKKITLDSTVTAIPNSAFYNSILEDITIPVTVKSIGDNAFYSTPISSITLPSKLETIGNSAFLNCKNLGSIAFPSTLTTIGAYAFKNTPLTGITIPASVTKIDKEAFCSTEITSVTVPNTVTSFGDNAFSNNAKLTQAKLGASSFTKSIYSNMFTGCPDLKKIILDSTVTAIPNSAFYNSILEDITIPVTVKSIGDNAFYSTPISSITLPSKLETIGNSAFLNCKNLGSIVFPDTLTTIGAYAFKNTPLTGITIPASVTKIDKEAFCSTEITSVTVPNTVTSFGDNAFSNNANLTDAKLGASSFSKSIYSNMFTGCPNLKKIILDSTVTAIPNNAFYNSILEDITIPVTVKSIGDNAFYSTPIRSVTLPSKLETIGNSAFLNCENLTSIAFPPTLTSIGAYAFKNTPLTGINIPASVTKIDREAFCNTEITSVDIPNTVKSFGDNAFSNNTKLTSATIGASSFNKSIYSNLFSGCENLKTITMDNTNVVVPNSTFYSSIIEQANIPEGVTSIGDSAFISSAVIDPVIPSTVKTIGSSAFANCQNIKNVDLPADLEIIRSYAFKKTALEKVYIPSKTTTLEREAFSNNEALKTVFIPNSVTSIGADAFANCPNLTIVCYQGSYAQTYATKNNINVKVLDPNGAALANNSTVSKNAVIKGSSVTITGGAEGGSGVYEYKFSYKKSGSSKYTVKSDYGKAASVKLTPASVDTYTVKVEVRDETGTVVTKLFTVESLNPLANNSTISATTYPAKASITINGIADGGKGPYKFKFSYKKSGDSDFITKSDYGKADSVVFTPQSVDTYTIMAEAKDSVGNYKKKTFTLTTTAALENKSKISKTTVEKGKSVKITGAAVGGKGTYQYKFAYKKSGAKNFTLKSDFGKATSVTLTPASVGTYTVKVYVKDDTGRIVSKTFTVTSTAAFENTSTVSAETVEVGTKITITGSVEGGKGPFEYKYSYKRGNAADYTLKADYSSKTSITLTPKYVDTYTIKVDVKDKATGKEIEKLITVKVTEVLKNKSRMAIEYDDNDNAYVKIDGSASGGAGGYKYAFYFKKADAEDWTKIGTEFGTATSAKLKSGLDAVNNIKVVVKDSSGKKVTRNFVVSVY